jgi:NTE family protein
VTSSQKGSRTRTLVLGGGGAVGIAWQTGLLSGLRDAGVDLASAETIVGTSAGALVGALLSGDREVTDSLASLAALKESIDLDSLAAGDQAFLEIMRQARLDADPHHALRVIGRAANEADTLAEDVYLNLFSTIDGIAWPSNYRCTAIDTDSGDLVVWDHVSDVPLAHAVAASCAIPALFPAVTIKGRRYMDGGLFSTLNTAAAPQTDVLVVLSCHPLDSKGTGGGGSLATSVTPNAEIAPLRYSRRLRAVEPDFSHIEDPVNMMDPKLVIEAFQIGRRQSADEVAPILAVWGL